MPTFRHWTNFFFMNLFFIGFICYIVFFIKVNSIHDNWEENRCNPMYMPFAENVNENFQYCVQSIQQNYFGYLMQPITATTQQLSSTMGGISNDIQNIRAMFDKIRTFFTTIIESIFSVFLNLIIEFQKIIIGIKDLFAKTIGILVTILYVLDGSIKTMNSTWNGPPGQLVQNLGKCFHPLTCIELENGKIITINKIKLNDIIKGNHKVTAILYIDNINNPVLFYQFHKNIIVSSTHLVYSYKQQKFVMVENHEDSKICTNITNPNTIICLITDTHRIPIGQYIFWDWEDHYIKQKIMIF